MMHHAASDFKCIPVAGPPTPDGKVSVLEIQWAADSSKVGMVYRCPKGEYCVITPLVTDKGLAEAVEAALAELDEAPSGRACGCEKGG